MNLLFDIGNSTLRWGWLDDDHQLSIGDTLNWPTHPDHVLQQIDDRLGDHLPEPPVTCWVANVGPRAALYPLLRALEIRFGRRPRLCFSEPACCGVRNGYEDFGQLGVDRWLALIGARQHTRTPHVLVVDAGTALTVDLLEGEQHRGGLIMPGHRLMERCLMHNTAALSHAFATSPAGDTPTTGLGRTTREAILGGIHYMPAATLQMLYADLSARLTGTRQQLEVLLTGGDAGLLADLIALPHTHIEPHLVLEGLAATVRHHLESSATAPTD